MSLCGRLYSIVLFCILKFLEEEIYFHVAFKCDLIEDSRFSMNQEARIYTIVPITK
jgi:hypothetical protein